MEAIDNMGKMGPDLLFYVSLFSALVPIIYLGGHLISSQNREALFSSPLLVLYFVMYFVFSYFFWFDYSILALFGLSALWVAIIYIIYCLGVIIETSIVN